MQNRLLYVLFTVLVLVTPAPAQVRSVPLTCSYEVRVWNVNSKSSGPITKTDHPYSELRASEIDRLSGCSICSEDQEIIDIPPLPSFSVCYKFASKVRHLIQDLLRQGESINTITGYHVIKSRGLIDQEGNRTEFSNHSFGTAIDINSEQNGLYDNCVEFGLQCRLVRGGEWRPGKPGTLEKNSDIVVRMKQAGFKWGGEIAGKQKDFMHFSLTGY